MKTLKHEIRHLAMFVAFALVAAGASSAFAKDTMPEDNSADSETNRAEETAQSEETGDEETSADRDSDRIADGTNAGLDLGGESLTADQALAHVDQAREKAAPEESDEPTAEGDSLSTSTSSTRPCEPYPECAEADLGSKKGVFKAEPFLEVAEKHNDAIQSCYEEAIGHTDIDGKVVLKFEIGSDGKARHVVVQSMTQAAEGFGECAAEEVKNWNFPDPSMYGHDDSLAISYPYSFGSN